MLELSRLIDRRSSSRVRREQSRESTSSGGEMPADSLKYRRPQMIRPELCSTPVYRIEEEKENVKKLFFRFQSISVFFFVGIFAWGRLFQLILRSVKSSRRKLDDWWCNMYNCLFFSPPFVCWQTRRPNLSRVNVKKNSLYEMKEENISKI